MRKLVAWALVGALASSQGCALVLRGGTQPVELAGDRVEVDGKPAKPGMLELERRSDHVVYAFARGQHESRVVRSKLSVGWFVFDLAVFGVAMCPVGSVTFLVDLVSGSLYELDESEVAFPVAKGEGIDDVTSATAPGR